MYEHLRMWFKLVVDFLKLHECMDGWQWEYKISNEIKDWYCFATRVVKKQRKRSKKLGNIVKERKGWKF